MSDSPEPDERAYRRWLGAQRTEPSATFPEDVMARVRASHAALEANGAGWLQRPLAQAALWAAAGILLILRLSVVLGIFLAGCAGRA